MDKKEAINTLIALAVCSSPELYCDEDCPFYDETKNEECTYEHKDFKLKEAIKVLKEEKDKTDKVLEIAFQYGQIDGDHHKTWVIDQMVRTLTGDKYDEFVKKYEIDEETGEKEWTWENGIAP
jgi:hypothetical protein